jgi:hypothetical protein
MLREEDGLFSSSLCEDEELSTGGIENEVQTTELHVHE